MIPKRILFSTDFSDNSLPARHLAVEYAEIFGSDLLILHVINSSQLGYPSLDEGLPMDIRSALETIQKSVDKALNLIATECRRNIAAVACFSRIGNPASEIIRFAEENGVGLIVMGTHGLTGIKHLMTGSTAENVVRTAGCPVITVRSPKT